MEVQVINLSRSPHRWEGISAHLTDLGVEHERFEGVDGRLIDDYDFDRWRANHPHYLAERKTDNGIRGWLGCVRSHRSVAEKIAAEWNGPVLVLEDDTRLQENWFIRLEAMRKSVHPDLSLLGFWGGEYGPAWARGFGWLKMETPRLSHAYVIEKREVAEALAMTWRREDVECDESWWPVIKQFNTWGLVPPAAAQSRSISDITGRPSGWVAP